jgi:hypothetical protein
MRAYLLLLWIPIWLSACSSKSESVVVNEQEGWRKPPPPPDGIWDATDSMQVDEEGIVYSHFKLVKSSDYKNSKLPCCFQFSSVFDDVKGLGIQQQSGSNVFFFSRVSNPLRFDESKHKMVDILIDDESQSAVFFQIPAKSRHFLYTDRELKSIRLTDAASCFCASLDDAGKRQQIQKGRLEGHMMNDTTWKVKLDASYLTSDDDSSWTVTLQFGQFFHVRKPDTLQWVYSCKDE